MIPTLKRTIAKFRADDMSDHAAALTYYAMLALFPALLVVVALLGLVGDRSLVADAVEYAGRRGAPTDVTDALRALLTTTIDADEGAVSSALALGVAIALYGAAGAFGAAGRALNDIHGVQEDRGFVTRKLVDLGLTVVVIALGIVALVSVFLGGRLAHDLLGTIGLGDDAAAVWRVARWAVAVGAVLGAYALVLAGAPNIAARPRLVSVGALVGVAIWMVASIGFFLYVSHFGSYGATYGAFAGAVVLLLWLYLSNLALLFGAELDSVVDGPARARARTRERTRVRPRWTRMRP